MEVLITVVLIALWGGGRGGLDDALRTIVLGEDGHIPS